MSDDTPDEVVCDGCGEILDAEDASEFERAKGRGPEGEMKTVTLYRCRRCEG